jgi:hypothetical protein
MKLLLYLIIVQGAINHLDARLFKLSPIPINEIATATNVDVNDTMNKVECASHCDAVAADCKAFVYLPSRKLCQLKNFQFADPILASSANWVTGYVEYGENSFLKFM